MAGDGQGRGGGAACGADRGPVEDDRGLIVVAQASSKSSMQFPEGSWITSCEPPGPVLNGTRILQPAASMPGSWDFKSSVTRTILFQPPDEGVSPSAVGCAADERGPASQSVNGPRLTMAIAGPYCAISSNSRTSR